MSRAIIKTQQDLKLLLHNQYRHQIQNFMGDEKKAMKFLSSVMASVQKNPNLLNCEGTSLVNAFMTVAQLGFMPSDVSGEAYVLPYKNKNGQVAQFQLGYQGLITLFYRAGGQKLRAEIVREHDDFSYENGVIRHKIDIFKSNKERGEAVGAYAIATVNGQEISKAMNSADILVYGSRFSKSYSSDYSPWKEKNDPELMMWKKTVIKQLAKLLPKNEQINKAIAEDNKDSSVSDTSEKLKNDAESMKMGNLVSEPKVDNSTAENENQEPRKEA